jgi:3'-phosphoadenosine 5'-phosphosulfate sulfotransferase
MGRESERRRLSAIAPRPLIRVLARSKSDKDAVENSLKHFVGSEAEVGSLKGARKPNDAEDQLKNHADFKGLVIVMLGLEDLGLFELSTKFPANFVFYLVPRSKVRNERPHRILRHYLKAKAMFRLNVRWDSENSMYTLLGQGEILEGWRVHPRYDVYMPTKGMVEKLASSYSIRPTLMLKKLAGHYSLYSGEKIVANMMLAEKGYQIKVERASQRRDSCRGLEQSRIAQQRFAGASRGGLCELLVELRRRLRRRTVEWRQGQHCHVNPVVEGIGQEGCASLRGHRARVQGDP